MHNKHTQYTKKPGKNKLLVNFYGPSLGAARWPKKRKLNRLLPRLTKFMRRTWLGNLTSNSRIGINRQAALR